MSFLLVRLAQGHRHGILDKAITSIEGITEHSWVEEDAIQVGVAQGTQPSKVLRQLVLSSVEVREVREIGYALEDVFLSVVEDKGEVTHE